MSKRQQLNLSVMAEDPFEAEFTAEDVNRMLQEDYKTPSIEEEMPKFRENVQQKKSSTKEAYDYDGSEEEELEKFLQTTITQVNHKQQSAPIGDITGAVKGTPTVTGVSGKEDVERQRAAQQQVTGKQNAEGEDAYVIALNLIKELGLMDISQEDLANASYETLQDKARKSREDNLNRAVDLVRKEVEHDPFMVTMFDYALEGKSYTDIPKMVKTLNTQADFAHVSLKTVQDQEDMYSLFLEYGKNPANPQDKVMLDMIPTFLEAAKKEGNLEQKAVEAKNYFIQLKKEEAQRLFKEAAEKKSKEFEEARKIEQGNKKWEQQFWQSLKNSKMAKERKEEIAAQLEAVKLQDGSTHFIYALKEQIIKEDPILFKHFLNFLSAFDLESNSFKSKSTHRTAETPSTVEAMLHRISKKTAGSGLNSQAPSKLNKTENSNFVLQVDPTSPNTM